MLPPLTELKSQRQIHLTDAGREATESLSGGELSHGLTRGEVELLAKLKKNNGVLAPRPATKLGIDASGLQQLQRRGLIEIREITAGRKRKVQRIVAWKGSEAAITQSPVKKSEEKDDAESQSAQRTRGEERVRELLETERGPLPLPQLLKLAKVTRTLIERMLRDGLLESWEEPIDPAEDPFDAGYTPPAHELNADQESVLKAIRARFELGEFGVQLLHGVTGSGKTFTVASVLAQVNRPALVLAHNKTLAAQLYQEFKAFFPKNAVEYFVSYYDYYQPEAYVPQTDTYIEKDSSINDEVDRLRHSATNSLLTRRDTIVVASVSCIYGLGTPQEYVDRMLKLKVGGTIERDALLRKLVGTAQVFIENYRPGTLERMGLGPEILHARNRRLVIVRVDPETRLPIDLRTTQGMAKDDPTFAQTFVFDYPETGPEDIFALGVPRTATIVDWRRPAGAKELRAAHIEARADVIDPTSQNHHTGIAVCPWKAWEHREMEKGTVLVVERESIGWGGTHIAASSPP
jgi:hypothetical protein